MTNSKCLESNLYITEVYSWVVIFTWFFYRMIFIYLFKCDINQERYLINVLISVKQDLTCLGYRIQLTVETLHVSESAAESV